MFVVSLNLGIDCQVRISVTSAEAERVKLIFLPALALNTLQSLQHLEGSGSGGFALAPARLFEREPAKQSI